MDRDLFGKTEGDYIRSLEGCETTTLAERSIGWTIYYLKNLSAGLVKIGITQDLARRKRELENASGCKLRVRFYVTGLSQDLAEKIECRLHRRYTPFRREGEWFEWCLAIKSDIAAITSIIRKHQSDDEYRHALNVLLAQAEPMR